MRRLIFILTLTILMAACSAQSPASTETDVELANPASENCIEEGGTLQIEERGDGGQIGVCYFDDNRQCEEWAMMRGDCPVGGLKVTDYITAAARYCAITGGEYTMTAVGDPETEQGNCKFSDGSACDAWDYYNGSCKPGDLFLE